MTAYLRPGVFVEETLNPLPPALGSNAQSVAAFIGAIDRGPVDVTAVTSWSQFTTLYGSYGANNLVHLAVLLFFSNGGGTCYVRRTVGTGAATATRSFNDRATEPASTLRLSAANPGVWGNGLNITIANSISGVGVDVVVYKGGTTSASIVEKFTDLSMTTADSRYLVGVINGQSNYIVAEDLGSSATGGSRLPVAVTNQFLAGGNDGSAVTQTNIGADASAFDVVHNSLIMNAPGVTDATAVGQLITYAQNRGDVFVVVDPVAGNVEAQLLTAGSYTASSYAAVYYPQIVIKDPTSTVSGVTTLANPGGAIAGVFASTDASRGVFKAPAGLAARIGGAVSVKSLTNSELDSMNSASAAVNAIRYIPGSGIVIMGARTLNPTYVDKYVPEIGRAHV